MQNPNLLNPNEYQTPNPSGNDLLNRPGSGMLFPESRSSSPLNKIEQPESYEKSTGQTGSARLTTQTNPQVNPISTSQRPISTKVTDDGVEEDPEKIVDGKFEEIKTLKSSISKPGVLNKIQTLLQQVLKISKSKSD